MAVVSAPSATTQPETEIDVVIIGGGLAGLSAGLCLADANLNLLMNPKPSVPTSFVVLEREARLGGRTFTDATNLDLDFGGGYVGAAQNYIQYLLRRFEIQTVEEYLPHDKQWQFEYSDGTVANLPGNDPMALPGRRNCAIRLLELDTMALEVKNFLANPNKSRYASLDNISVAEWLDQQKGRYKKGNDLIGMSQETAEAFVCSVRSAFSVEPEELSFFYLLYYSACAGSYSALVDVAGGPGAAEGSRLPRGTQELVARLRKEIEAPTSAGSIVPGATVLSIKQDAAGAQVLTSDGRAWRAKRVIVAMSPATVGAMAHEIQDELLTKTLEDAKHARAILEDGMSKCKGRTIKGFVKFKGPFWRNQPTPPPLGQGLMGFLLSAGNLGLDAEGNANHEEFPLDWTLDNVWDDPVTLERRTSMMTFIVGAAADHWVERPLKERARAVIEHLRKIYKFTDAQLLDPTDPESNYVERNWPGASTAELVPSPAAMLGKGVFLKCSQALRHSIGVVHYGGSESALEWNGYMDGAIQSGFRTASEVLAALKRPL
jgi:monoamine oxidase